MGGRADSISSSWSDLTPTHNTATDSQVGHVLLSLLLGLVKGLPCALDLQSRDKGTKRLCKAF